MNLSIETEALVRLLIVWRISDSANASKVKLEWRNAARTYPAYTISHLGWETELDYNIAAKVSL